MTGRRDERDARSFYEVLGASRDATVAELRSAYVAQAKRYHPDLHGEAPSAQREAAAAEFRAVALAWDCLSDRQRRDEYDRTLHAPATRRPVEPDRSPNGVRPGDLKPSTWLARASLSAVTSALESTGASEQAITQTSSAVYRVVRPHLTDDEPAATVAEARRRAYSASFHAHERWRKGDRLDDAPVLNDIVGRSLWVMCHALWADLDAGERAEMFEPHASVDEHLPRTGQHPTGQCSVCGRGPSRRVRFRTVRGQVLLYRKVTVTGDFCRDCGQSIGREAQHVTLNAGWWGVVAIFVTVFAVVTNARALGRVSELGPASGDADDRRSPLDPGAPVSRRGLGGAVTFVALVAVLVVLLTQLR